MCKIERVPLPDLLQPLPVHTSLVSHLDWFCGKLTQITRHGPNLGGGGHVHSIWTFKQPFTAFKVAQLFVDNIHQLHGPPQVIVVDRDKVFTSLFWQEFMRLTGSILHLSSTYLPHTDEQKERLNQFLETYLHCMTFHNPQLWAKWLSLVDWWYNTTHYSTLKMSPFRCFMNFLLPIFLMFLKERHLQPSWSSFWKIEKKWVRCLGTISWEHITAWSNMQINTCQGVNLRSKN